jgi:predicted AAA+ superfamily ATPase
VKSLARNVCRLTEITTFASDVITNDKIEISRNTVATYLDFLQRQYLIESIPA